MTLVPKSFKSFPSVYRAILLLSSLLYACSSSVSVPPLAPDEIAHIEEIGNYPHVVYHIEPGDRLEINYPFHPEMKQEAVVQPDGKISAILAGPVTVAGLTTTEVENLLKERTSTHLRDPEVVVVIDQYAPKSVYVSGEVGKPGLVPYEKGLTPFQAITAAGGFKDTAQAESVVLVRTGADNEVVIRKLNLLETVTDGTKEPLHLAPHDIVYVPRSGIADADLWVKQHIRDLLPIQPGMRVTP
ncbi:MAG: polysaccharide export protein [Deltaproteobacteria bacterium]|nr:polysaccharide export protein [Deltaproteobacteria bacterium]